MKTNYKKYVPHTLGAVLLLGVLGWLAWLTVKGTSKEGMDNNDAFLNAFELMIRMEAPLPSWGQEKINKAVSKLTEEQKSCTVKTVNDNWDLLLESLQLQRNKFVGHTPFEIKLESACKYK